MSTTLVARAPVGALVAAAKSGDAAALEHLLLHEDSLRRVAISIAKKVDPHNIARGWDPVRTSGGLAAELESAFYLGILDALARFDPTRGVSFITFAYQFIKGEMTRALYGKAYVKDGVPLRPSIGEFSVDTGDDDAMPTTESELRKNDPEFGTDAGYLRVVADEDVAAVREFVAGLADHKREIVTLVYYHDEMPASLAANRGVTRQAVSKSLNLALAAGRDALAELRVAA